ncbi:hypothetical protein EVJ58_g4911 [Rhodofomes roseus]|uniref:Uncharacterized protein n=1 Tax=Rhodofomes roseus TaxID=34475 RepID=A0A4Y9YGV5_9APHY|nr:hypothetical protein EVJ58_g4911 [Rhodofomes roseus]
MAVLVIFLISATVSCFGAAYYLFTTRWDLATLSSLGDASDESSHVASSLPAPAPTQVVHFDFGSDPDLSPDSLSPSSLLSLSSSLSSVLSVDSSEKYLAYLPHSGFHNQRIAFENALVLSRLLNRTLLVPPVRLGMTPVYYLPFDQLRDVLANATKVGLEHCKEVRLDGSQDIPPECMDYYDFTYVPWEWLVDLSEIKTEQRVLSCWNLTDAWLEDRLNISHNDTFFFKDTARNHYSFLDFTPGPSSSTTALSRKYIESIQISALAQRAERLVFLGTLMGSSRLHLRNPTYYQLRARIREQMALTNPLLAALAEDVRAALGGQYLGAHVRLGDGLFRENGAENVRLTWWRLVHATLGFSIQDTLALEKALVLSNGDSGDDSGLLAASKADFDVDASGNAAMTLAPPRIPLDIPALRVPHPPLPPLNPATNLSFACPGTLHTAPALTLLNTPLFIATDVAPHTRTRSSRASRAPSHVRSSSPTSARSSPPLDGAGERRRRRATAGVRRAVPRRDDRRARVGGRRHGAEHV